MSLNFITTAAFSYPYENYGILGNIINTLYNNNNPIGSCTNRCRGSNLPDRICKAQQAYNNY
jgi:hypothetical protein